VSTPSTPTRLPARLPAAVADELATRTLRRAVERGLLPDRPLPDWERYRSFRAEVRASFHVPETSITPLMARVLYGIAWLARPRRILGIGTYCGNALVWLAAPGFGRGAAYRGTRAVGLDVDEEATGIAAANFARVAMGDRVELRCLDGHLAGSLGDAFDLVLLDADDPLRRKAVYLSLLEAVHPHVRAGGLVLAHDIRVPAFAGQLAAYQRLVRTDSRFAGSLSLEVDPCGLELTRTAGGAA